jgi:GntR family transcriptional regulator
MNRADWMGVSKKALDTVQDDTGAGRRPLYLTVYDSLKQALQEGRWKVGGSLPSEAALSAMFGVSRITTRHALRLMEQEGYIQKAQARRPVVVATEPSSRAGWVVESMDDIVAMVGDAQLEIESWRKERASADARLFGVLPGTELHCLRGTLSRAQKPYARSIIYFHPEIGSRLQRRAFDDPVVFRVLQREFGVRIDNVQLTIWAELATAKDAKSLRCKIGSALLVMQLLYRNDGGTLVEIAYSRALASEVRLSTRLFTSSRVP